VCVDALIQRSQSERYSFPVNELAALQDFYNSLDGLNWKWKKPYEKFGLPWNFTVTSPNPCSDQWQGVVCNSDCTISPCNVLEISLEDVGLAGHLPSSISNFTQLEFFLLYDNSISGPIPKSICALTSLLDFDFGENSLTGPIPDCIGNLTQLIQITLHHNQLTSSIPSSLQNCS
jgi:hypothetical protein